MLSNNSLHYKHNAIAFCVKIAKFKTSKGNSIMATTQASKVIRDLMDNAAEISQLQQTAQEQAQRIAELEAENKQLKQKFLTFNLKSTN